MTQLGDHDVEGSAGEIEPLGIHHGELLNVLQPSFEDTLARLSQHLLRKIDADHPASVRIIG